MSNLKLTIGLIPKGAWGNNLRERLSKKDWDKIRETVYSRSKYRCQICGADGDLDAHEEWEFDIESRTQTLKGIFALCTACHGVKHFRNSERIGYGDSAKVHFIKINKCSELTFAKHYTEQQMLFDNRNEVLRWHLKVDLSKYGFKDAELKERNIPLITNPYEGVSWIDTDYNVIFVQKAKEGSGFSDISRIALCDYDEPYMTKFPYCICAKKVLGADFDGNPMLPRIRSIEVNNYDGTIEIAADYTNNIKWIHGETVTTKYNLQGRFKTKFSVEDLTDKSIKFIAIGDCGEVHSLEFGLSKYS